MITTAALPSGQNTALQLLQNGRSSPPMVNKSALALVPTELKGADVFKFLGSSNFTVSSKAAFDGLVNAFLDPTLRDEFEHETQEETGNALTQHNIAVGADNAHHAAIYDVIMNHRDRFPPGEFSITTNFTGGGSITTTIPSLADIVRGVASKSVMQPADGAEAATKSVAPDDGAKLNAMEKAVQTLQLNGADMIARGLAEANVASVMLAQKLYSNDGLTKHGIA